MGIGTGAGFLIRGDGLILTNQHVIEDAATVRVSVMLAGIGVSTVVFHNTSALPILLVLSMVAFTGGVSVARLLPPSAPDRQRYRRDEGGDS